VRVPASPSATAVVYLIEHILSTPAANVPLNELPLLLIDPEHATANLPILIPNHHVKHLHTRLP